MRIGLKKPKQKQQQNAHTKRVARLVDSENWFKIIYNNKQQQNNNTRTQKVLLDFSMVRIGLKQNIKNNKNYNTHTQKVLLD